LNLSTVQKNEPNGVYPRKRRGGYKSGVILDDHGPQGREVRKTVNDYPMEDGCNN